MNFRLSQKLAAEALGTAFLLAAVIGSGVMGERLAGGNEAIALLANMLATGAALAVLIIGFGPISGAHFNPAVTLAFLLRREIAFGAALAFVLAQVAGGVAGVLAAHAMFELDAVQIGVTARTGPGQWLAEAIAAFGLVLFILLSLRKGVTTVAAVVGLYISSAYWFTASTSFANPAVTIARSFSDTFAGIRPADAPAFIAAQFLGAVLATALAAFFYNDAGNVASGSGDSSGTPPHGMRAA